MAHRAAWMVTHGQLDDDVRVLHRCDVRNCVRPDHLFLGSQADNVLDAMSKGRHRPPSAIRITDEQVREVRQRAAGGETNKAIAASLDVSAPLISMIVNGKRRRRVA